MIRNRSVIHGTHKKYYVENNNYLIKLWKSYTGLHNATVDATLTTYICISEVSDSE